MQRRLGRQDDNVFKGVGYGLVLSAVIIAGWAVTLAALF